ncbi:hypothetical protein ACFPPD_00775 [Cohnella suwonensis]|uniref:Galactose mutarotase n=1 Tax=Cohnella suwonensis TaxID=696072 RepID=A0ABW0LQI3_9BACL
MAAASRQWSVYEEQGYLGVLGENERLAVRIVPARGGKIVSLVDKRTEREWIHRTERPWEPLRYGMNWGEGDRGGWDEMFPTIDACPCPDEPWRDESFPDHGEVWCMPWRHAIEEDGLRLEVEGVRVPYRLSKKVYLDAAGLRIEYRLSNPTPHSFSYLWAAHPLLRVSPGMRLLTEPERGRIQVAYSHRNRLGEPLTFASYPEASAADGKSVVDLSVLESAESRAAEKYYFADPLREGYAAVADPDAHEALAFRFSPEDTPYLAIWAHYGGFDDYTFAVEPASGYMDSVQTAHRLGKAKRVEGGSENRWTLSVSLVSLD